MQVVLSTRPRPELQFKDLKVGDMFIFSGLQDTGPCMKIQDKYDQTVPRYLILSSGLTVIPGDKAPVSLLEQESPLSVKVVS